ncbi:MAG: hypothetical protein ACO307_09120 [Ilumatobacteraceae bacterium]
MGERAMRPFWMHQLVEYVLGAALIAQGMQEPEPVIPSLAGVVVLINAAAVRGPLGAFKVIGRRLHRWLDVVVAGLLVLGAVQPWVAVAVTTRALLLVVLLPLGFLWYYTDWDERSARRERRVAEASDRSDQIGRMAGRLAAGAVVAGKNVIKKRSEQ